MAQIFAQEKEIMVVILPAPTDQKTKALGHDRSCAWYQIFPHDPVAMDTMVYSALVFLSPAHASDKLLCPGR